MLRTKLLNDCYTRMQSGLEVITAIAVYTNLDRFSTCYQLVLHAVYLPMRIRCA